jgi:predicted ribosomally synthesized peptide with SipW-like signal peptide
MLKIAKSLIVIVAVVAVAAGATGAYFSDQATIANNTFSTGTLAIWINSNPGPITGATYSPMAPGQVGNSIDYHINNANLANFGGPSNLTAKYLALSVANCNDGGSGLCGLLQINVEVNRGWSTWHQAYNGSLSGLSNVDLLSPRWTELIAGSSEMMRYTITLPDDGTDQSALMGQTATWDLVVEGRTS